MRIIVSSLLTSPQDLPTCMHGYPNRKNKTTAVTFYWVVRVHN